MSLGSNVLVAIDGSEAADEALRAADERVRRDAGRLTVVHVLPNPLRHSPLFPQENLPEAERVVEAEARAATVLRERVTEVTGRAAGEFSVVLDNGAADTAIVNAAASMKASLVVLAADHAAEKGIGPVAKRVLHYAPTSVLVVRPRRGSSRYLVATDFSEAASDALRAVAPEVRARGARITLMHAVDLFPPHLLGLGAPFGATWVVPPRELVDQVRSAADTALRDLLEEFGLGGDVRVVEGNPAAAIVQAAADTNADLLVVAARGRTSLARMVLGSVAERVAADAPCSVLTVRGAAS